MIQVSPGVNVSEYDSTTVVPAVSTTAAAMAGVFRWGPAYQRVLVDSETTLVNKFGKPDSTNFETFFTAANFLAYGNALYVVRTYDATALNSVAPISPSANIAAANVQIDNYDDFISPTTTVNTNIAYLAKYAGSLGNSLKISVCDSPAAYSSTLLSSGTANITFTTGSSSAAVVGANAAAVNTAITIGDYIKVGNSTLGYQYLKIKSAGGGTVTFYNNYSLSTNTTVEANATSRYWEFYNAVDKAPGTSTYASNLGSTVKDEIHVVVTDEGGKFTGTPGQILEVWSGLSRATDATGQNGTTNFYKNVLNTKSQFVYTNSDRTGAATGALSTLSTLTTTPYTSIFTLGADGLAEGSIGLGDVVQGYDLYKGKEDVDISLLLQGKAVNVGGLGNYIIANIAEVRKDCVAFISPDNSIVTNNDPSQYAVNFRSSTNNVAGLTYNSSFAFMDGNYKYQYDKYNDAYRWVPLNGDMAGLCAATDFSRDAWYSPAGFTRGQIKNVTKLLYNPNQAQRDLLYKNDVNPVVTFPGQGTILYGDKTLFGKPSAFDRINVRRLFIVLEKAVSLASQSSLFEFNDSFTRNQFKNLVEPFLRQVQGRRGIYDFRVVCDETNNTQQVIDSNQFVGDIYIQPAKSINFIQLNFVAVRTGVDFNTIVGQF